MGRIRAPSFEAYESDDVSLAHSAPIHVHVSHPPSPIARFAPSFLEGAPAVDDRAATDLIQHIKTSCEVNAVQSTLSSSAHTALLAELSCSPSGVVDDTAELSRLLGLCHVQTSAELVRKDEMLRARAKAEMTKDVQARVAALASVEQKVKAWEREQAAAAEAKKKAEDEAASKRKAAEEAAARQAAKDKADAEAKEAAEKAATEAKEAAEKAAADATAKVKEDAAKAAEPAPASLSLPAAPAPAKKEAHIVASEARLQKWLAVQAANGPILESTDPNVKKIRMNVKKQIGEACNQVANTPASIQLVVKKLCQVLMDARSAGPEYLNLSLDTLAARLTSQVKVLTEIRSCFPLAHVASMCSVHTPELADMFVAHLNKLCPFTVPCSPARQPGQSDEEYTTVLGWEWDTENGKRTIESPEKYQMRMNMAVALLAATMQTTPYDGSPQPAGLTIEDCWTWLANLVNSKPNTFTATVVLSLLETAGFQLAQRFGRQFQKLLELIQRDLLPHLSREGKTGAAASLARLNTFLTDGHVRKEPEGRLPKESEISKADEEAAEGDNNYGNSSYNNRGSGGAGRGRGRGRGGYR
ncbi:hypothetical protein ACHHYP_15141 [Achlya hypogyna]|uniref:mRNA export factor GLE1 n=1 Tax=Achlya hypogyna TaxID=1202772 RepID=A0A1V9ZEZ8_ACHHY|nr:hypothetical protein ACHHYP_15141 [Achlya hypogyna]